MQARLGQWLEGSPQTRWVWAGVFCASVLAALAFRLAALASLFAGEVTDYAHFYHPVARHLLAGQGLVDRMGRFPVRYPPGYPLLLAGVFWVADALHISEGTAVVTFNLLCMGLASVLVFVLARSVWGTRAGLAAALLWLTYPFALWVAAHPTAEAPFLPFFFAAALIFWRALQADRPGWLPFAAAGVLWGSAMLIRPAALGLGPIMASVAVADGLRRSLRRRLEQAAAILVGGLLVVLPWEALAYARTGQIIVLSTGSVPGIRDGLTFAVYEGKGRTPIWVPAGVEAVQRAVLARYDELRSAGDVAAVLAEQIREQPLGVAGLFAIKAARSWYGTDSQAHDSSVLLVQLPYLTVILWGSRSAFKRGGQARRLAVLVWLVALYSWGMTILVLSILRYMLPAVGLLFALAPGALRLNRHC